MSRAVVAQRTLRRPVAALAYLFALCVARASGLRLLRRSRVSLRREERRADFEPIKRRALLRLTGARFAVKF